MATETPGAVKLHPKVKAAAQVAAVLVALDGLLVALAGALPSPALLSAVAALHAFLPVVAAYLKSDEGVAA